MAKEPMTQDEQDLLPFLRDTVRPVASSWVLIHFHLSSLHLTHQTKALLGQAKKILLEASYGYRSKIFLLSNNDIMLFIQNVSLFGMERFVDRLRTHFKNDPLAEKTLGKDSFYSSYHMGHSFDFVFDYVEKTRPPQQTIDLSQHIPLEPAPVLPIDLLLKLQNIINHADMVNYIRKQPICWMQSMKKAPKPLGFEYFLSLEGIEDMIHSHTHLVNDFSLFKYLSILFDKKMLESLRPILQKTAPHQHFHLNLNLRTVVSKEFFDFHTAIDREFVVEIDRTDVLWDLDSFYFACDFLKSHGHRVCLDLIQGPNLLLLNTISLPCDFYKIIASEDLFSIYHEEFKAFADHVGYDKIILARCDCLQTVQSALDHGVSQFQGFLIDNVLRHEKKSSESVSKQPIF